MTLHAIYAYFFVCISLFILIRNKTLHAVCLFVYEMSSSRKSSGCIDRSIRLCFTYQFRYCTAHLKYFYIFLGLLSTIIIT